MTVSHESDAPSWSRVEGTLIATARVVRSAYDSALAPIGINLAEATVLAHLGSSGALTQVELARRIGTGKARIGAYIDSLQAANAVQRQPDPSDRRAWSVSLTDKGHELWASSRTIDRSVRRRLRRGISAQQIDLLDAMLVRIGQNLTDDEPVR